MNSGNYSSIRLTYCNHRFLFCRIVLFSLFFQSCNIKPAIEMQQGVFTVLAPEQTGVTFSNNVTESDSLNILDYLYFYNGAGVASADFNNDGLQDLYFISNQESNRLYLNQGNLKFEDITRKSKTEGTGTWKTGVTVVDINNDGYKDIYVSVVSGYKSFSGKNQLYINQGDLTFREQAHEYGLDFAGLSTQASFFDYDHDGDLDMYLLTHSVHSNDTYGDSLLRYKYNETAGDHLYRNDHNHFSDVTRSAGIYGSPIGYGLGISIADFNNDGWDDIYVSNDFFEQDYYYVNQQNGTFKEKLKEAFGHSSKFSMGNAAGDINKDGNLDVISTDMLPEDMKVLKSTINDEPLDIYNLEVKSGFYNQYSRNSLQLNVAEGKKFIDIALYSGLAATDWTWSPLIQDFDMDGRKDVFFSNGIKKRLNDLDFLKYLGNPGFNNGAANERQFDRTKINKMPDGRVHNFLFQGNDALKFRDVSASNDMIQVSASSGAVSVDLDNDGDLEIITNNMDEPAFIYQNARIKAGATSIPPFLKFSIRYKGNNRDAIGAKLFMRSAKGTVDHQEIQTSSGFQSSQNQDLLFTFPAGDGPSSLLVIWPDNTYQEISRFALGTKKDIFWNNESHISSTGGIQSIIRNFISGSANFNHQDVNVELMAKLKVRSVPDFNYYSLLPHTYLNSTPAIAAGDVNNDGYDDLYVGGEAGENKYLMIGHSNGRFTKKSIPVFSSLKEYGDTEAKWADLDNDGDSDLVVTNTEYPFSDFKKAKAPQVFMNLGNFKFELKTLPLLHSPTSKFAVLDYNGDGLKDIFLAGAVNFRNYTKALPSYLLLNLGNGNFEKASVQMFSELAQIPYIRDLTVADLNKDGYDDLVISAEWQPIQVFLNNGKMLKKKSLPALDSLKGWWQSATVTDLDQDGKADLVAGNWGLNNKYNVTGSQPLLAYNSDVDQDGKHDLIVSYFYKGNHYPFRPKTDLEQELPYLKKEWLSYQKMADKSTAEIFKDRITDKDKLEARTFKSLFISDVLNSKTTTSLPYLYQQAPILTAIKTDSPAQVIINGNFSGVIPYEGRYDAVGLATLEYDKKAKGFLAPRYWVNPQINFSQINFITKVRSGRENRWVILTAEGNLMSVSVGDLKPVLSGKFAFNKWGNKL
jgi:hypothetical protein